MMTLLTIDMALILEKLLLVVVVISASLVIAMYTTFAERKVAAVLQDRSGPNRAGPFGLLQPLADGLKLFFKEEIIPNFSSKFLFILGPALAMLTAMMTSAAAYAQPPAPAASAPAPTAGVSAQAATPAMPATPATPATPPARAFHVLTET